MINSTRLTLLKQLARGMAAQFGQGCEVVIHDLTGPGLEHTVVHIENGHVTGRKVGDGPSRAAIEVGGGDHLAYLTRTKDGKLLKSTTLYIRDERGIPEAIFSINYDVSALRVAEGVLHELATPMYAGDDEPRPITQNVADLLDELLDRSVTLIGKPIALMDRDDKIRAIRFLDQSGALLITKAGDKIAAYFGISKYTLYNYLDREEAI